MSKRCLVLILAVAMVALLSVPAFGTEPVIAYTAVLGFTNTDWTVQEWGDTVSTQVTEDGIYTLRLEGAATDVETLFVDIRGAYDAIAKAQLALTNLQITVDGREVPVDLSKVLIREVEGNGNYRIEIYDLHGETHADPAIDPADICFSTELTVTFTLFHKSADRPGQDTQETLPDTNAQESSDPSGTQPAQPRVDPWLIGGILAVMAVLAAGGVAYLLLKKKHG